MDESTRRKTLMLNPIRLHHNIEDSMFLWNTLWNALLEIFPIEVMEKAYD